MTEVFAQDCNKFDIQIEVRTLCRRSKTTNWAQLVENGFELSDDQKWDKEDLVIETSGVGHARMGLLMSYMTDVNRYIHPAIAKAILPELNGVANGLGKIVLVGYVEGNPTPNPLITSLFEFSQQPGERIKVSKSMRDCFKREEEIRRDTSLLLVRDLFYALESKIAKDKVIPRVTFADTEEVPAVLRGRRFSPCLSRVVTAGELKRSVVINFREHATEPEGICPPYLFSLFAEEDEEGELSLTYEGNKELTDDHHLVIKEVLFAFRDVIYDSGEGVSHTRDTVTH